MPSRKRIVPEMEPKPSFSRPPRVVNDWLSFLGHEIDYVCTKTTYEDSQAPRTTKPPNRFTVGPGHPVSEKAAHDKFALSAKTAKRIPLSPRPYLYIPS